VARTISKYIPGNPTVVVENQPGAASLSMTSSLYNTQPRDGTVIGAAINGMPTAPLLAPTGVRFDPTKLTWLGSTNSEVQVTYVWYTAPVQSFADLLTKELITGATQPGTTQVDFPLVANAVLGTKFKVISGYLGTTDIHKAMEAGEVQGNGASAYASLKELNADWLAEKKVKVILQWGFHKHPDLPDVPSVLDMAKNEADKQALRLVLARLQYSRPFFAPPGLPPERTAALRHAFDMTMKDPEFLAEAAKLQLEIAPVSGEDVAALVAEVSATPPDVVARVRAALAAPTGK
jgi:tripartite-type tricarboxylate transporter receptor subunit TctC